ncbi:MAG: methyl-accepting chemotaxis protein, partial [Treponema sp.]|nr:methyl-accepting chemotaxis protein [Treponema sp.]
IAVREDGNHYYIVDGSGDYGSDIFSYLGDEVDPDDYGPPYAHAWETKSRQTTPIEINDWGYLISIYEPIFNSRGDMVGLLGCDFDAKLLYESVRSQAIEQIILGLIFTAAGVAIMYLLIRRIFIRLGNISRILEILASGEGDLSARIKITLDDEIGNMAGLFNKTMDKICELVLLVKNQTTNLSNVGNELSENMNQTESAVKEITGNIQHIKGQVINQSASVTQTNATMEQMVDNIGKLSTQVEAQTESVTQSSAAIEEMLANIKSVTDTLVKNAENVDRLITASELGRTSIEGVSEDIKGIAQESEGLLEINKLMQDISSQTNLLSMNAAIEAAHAGEAGRGFAVVASEIRKLAESSSDQSKTISTVLKKIKESIDQIIKSTGAVLSKFEDIDTEIQTVYKQESHLRVAMEEQNEGSRQILEAIDSLKDITRHVKEGSTEMLKGSREVIKEGKNLASATEQIASGINDIASGADYINSTVGRVNDISGTNKEHINSLSKEVERFKVEVKD